MEYQCGRRIVFRGLLFALSADTVFDDGIERRTFERLVEYVSTTRLKYDKSVAQFLQHVYTNWSAVNDTLENRRQYIDVSSS